MFIKRQGPEEGVYGGVRRAALYLFRIYLRKFGSVFGVDNDLITTAFSLLSFTDEPGTNSPTLEEWKACLGWAGPEPRIDLEYTS